MLRARLARRIAFWIFLNFLVVEALVLVPSVLRQADRLGAQLRQVSSAKIDWLVAEGQAGSSPELLAAVQRLRRSSMLQAIEGASLYRASSGERLGGFGARPQLSGAQASRDRIEGRWYPLRGSYDAVWGPESLGGDHLLVMRHEASSIRAGLLSYTLNITLIVLGIAAFLTLITLVVMQRLVIGRIVTLRDRLVLAGRALASGATSSPESLLLPPGAADEVGDVEQAFNQSFLTTAAEMERRRVAERSAQQEQARADQLLLNILPSPIAAEMKQGRRTIAETHADVSVLFADIEGFTALAARLPCHALVQLLNQVFTAFDQLCERHGLEKIKTIGDNYMVVGGLPLPHEGHADAMAAMALDMQAWMREFRSPEADGMALRIGMHSGPVVAGVIGTKKFIYDLWGETVNIASRMESHGIAGRIQVSEALARRLEPRFHVQQRGSLLLKGVGAMTTYWLEPPAPAAPGSA